MNRLKITLLSSLLLLMASALFACTPAQKMESVNDANVATKKESANVGQTPLKNRNEDNYKLLNVQHRQHVQSLSQQFPDIVFYKGKSHLKRVALTFDDGPDNYYTPRILDILNAKKVPGTFFMVGKEVKRFPDMVKRIVGEGNAIGNHTWNHPKLWKLTNDQVTQEIVSTDNEIQRITGRRSDLFRPPYGRVTPADVILIHNLGYRIINWSIDTTDWKGTPAPKILRLVNREVSPEGIILEHCLAERPGELNGTLQALPKIIDKLRSQGYEFVTVPTLLGS